MRPGYRGCMFELVNAAIKGPDLPKPPSINYAQYTELLSRVINDCAVPHQKEQVLNFENAQPETCPHCGERVRSQFNPTNRISHDIANCPRRPGE